LSCRHFNLLFVFLLDLHLYDNAHQPPVKALQSFLHSLPTPSAVTSTISHITRLLLLHAAEAYACSHLLLGHSLTAMSVSLISSISSGGGFVVREEREEDWNSIRIVKPLRDVTSKECAAWVHWHRLSVLGGGITLNNDMGVTRLTRDFIVGLDKDFPSTVSTISRTCAKLAPKVKSGHRLCAFCQRSTYDSVQDWKARISIRSRNTVVAGEAQATASLVPHLCYACHTAFTSKNSKGAIALTETIAALPVWVGANNYFISEGRLSSRNRLSQDMMKAQIDGFLLDNE